MSVVRRRGQEMAAAWLLLTRFPLMAADAHLSAEAIAGAVWAYPLVGAIIGSAGAGVIYGSGLLGLPPAIGAITAVAAMIWVTGALHEDGLADTADGLGGGQTRERKLEIMRDSRIGSFGAVTLMIALAIRVAAVAELCARDHGARALITAATLGRSAMLIPLGALRPARANGLASAFGKRDRRRIALGIALGYGIAAGLGTAPLLLAAAAVAALWMSWTARRQVGGYTGDVLGATCVLAECAALLAAVITMSPR